jgi:hypothetical protein
MSNPPNPIPQSSTGRRTFARHVAPFAPVALALAMNAVPHKTSSTAPEPAAATSSAELTFVESCPSPAFPTDVATDMDEEPCSVAGSGGAETWQNEAKNNFCAADPAQPITLPEMLKLQAQVQQDSTIPFGNSHNHPLTSTAGPAKDRSHLVAMGEGHKVGLQGFVKLARQEGGESVNCGKTVPNQPQYHDIHISIVQSPDDSECSGVVVEMVPHHRPSGWMPTHTQPCASPANSCSIPAIRLVSTESPTRAIPHARLFGRYIRSTNSMSARRPPVIPGRVGCRWKPGSGREMLEVKVSMT